MINLANIVNSPEFREQVTLIKNTESINSFGESTTTNTSVIINAVVTPYSDAYLHNPNYKAVNTKIELSTTQHLSTSFVGSNPDTVLYHSDTYRLVTVDDSSSFGFFSAIAELINPLPSS